MIYERHTRESLVCPKFKYTVTNYCSYFFFFFYQKVALHCGIKCSSVLVHIERLRAHAVFQM